MKRVVNGISNYLLLSYLNSTFNHHKAYIGLIVSKNTAEAYKQNLL